MTRKKIIISIFLALIILVPFLAKADDLPTLGNIHGNLNTAVGGTDINTGVDIYQFIGNIIKALLAMLGVVLLVLIIYGGYIWLTSLGESAKIEKAKGIIKASIIGVIIVLTSYVIVHFVFTDLLKQ